jgi:hypothetical protein
MSVILMGAVKQRGPVEGPLRHTLLVICDEADDFGFACPSTESIADGSCCSVRQVIRRIELLETQGWIKVKRKVFAAQRGEPANAYFVDTNKLGVERSKQTRRSPIWTKVERLLHALESRDKVSLLNGVLKFEKTPESIDIPASGDLFDDDSASDTMSLANEPVTGDLSANLGVSPAIAAKTVEKGAGEVENDDFAGDMVSRDKCHPRHVTSDIHGKPFNVLPVLNPFQQKLSTPPTPASGGGAGTLNEIVLDSIAAQGAAVAEEQEQKHPHEAPVQDGPAPNAWAVTPAARRAAQLMWQTTRIMREHNIGADSRIETAISEALEMHCSKTGCLPEQAAELEMENYREWERQSHLMTHNWGWRWWFKRGFWCKPNLWPYDRQRMREAQQASVGVRTP